MMTALEAGILYICVIATLGFMLKAYQLIKEYYDEFEFECKNHGKAGYGHDQVGWYCSFCDKPLKKDAK